MTQKTGFPATVMTRKSALRPSMLAFGSHARLIEQCLSLLLGFADLASLKLQPHLQCECGHIVRIR